MKKRLKELDEARISNQQAEMAIANLRKRLQVISLFNIFISGSLWNKKTILLKMHWEEAVKILLIAT